MSVALILLFIGAGIIIVGIVLAILGLVLDPGPGGIQPVAAPSLGAELVRLIRRCFGIIVSPTSRRWQKVAAFGMLLVFIGVAFLLSSGIDALIMAGIGGGNGDPTPTPTAS